MRLLDRYRLARELLREYDAEQLHWATYDPQTGWEAIDKLSSRIDSRPRGAESKWRAAVLGKARSWPTS